VIWFTLVFLSFIDLPPFPLGLVPGMWTSWHGVVQFVSYEHLSSWLLHSLGRSSVTSDIAMVSGGVSKVLAMVATFPLNVIKTRLQEQRQVGAAAGAADSPAKYRGLTQGIQRIVAYGHFKSENGDVVMRLVFFLREEGIRGLYKGLGPSLWRLGLNSAIFFGIFEYSKRVLVAFPVFQSASAPQVAAVVTKRGAAEEK